MLSGDRVLLRPIERSDLPRLWELLEDVEVAALAETRPDRPTSLVEYPAKFDERLREATRTGSRSRSRSTAR
jgi:hypothetical protein